MCYIHVGMGIFVQLVTVKKYCSTIVILMALIVGILSCLNDFEIWLRTSVVSYFVIRLFLNKCLP